MTTPPTTKPSHPPPNPPDSRPLPRDVHDTTFDWTTWHLIEEEDVGQSPEQMVCIKLLTSVTQQWVAEQGWDHLWVGSDIFTGWKEDDPQVMVSPDVLILRPAPDLLKHKSIQTWRPEQDPPLWAVEVVSDSNKSKDYDLNPAKYHQIGVEELVMFDPQAAWRAIREKVRGKRLPGRTFLHQPIEMYRRDAHGQLVQTDDTGREPVYSAFLQAWLVVVPAPDNDGARLRIARDAEGLDLVPSLAEAHQAAHTSAQQALAAAELAEATAERERQSREAAEAAAERERQNRKAAEAAAEHERQNREAAEAAAEQALTAQARQQQLAQELAALLGSGRSNSDPRVQALLLQLQGQLEEPHEG